MNPTIRPLEKNDWAALRDLRLFALQTEPGVYCSSYEREGALGEADWITRIIGPGKRLFGLVAGNELVGITGVVPLSTDHWGATAELVMSYILPPYRRQGLSALLYDARLRWARAQPSLRWLRSRIETRTSRPGVRASVTDSSWCAAARGCGTTEFWPTKYSTSFLC